MATRFERDQLSATLIATTASLLKGDGAGNATAATSGADYVIPSGTVATATTANGLNSATTTVVVNAATAPISGQVLTATGPNAANWQTPSGGGGSNPWTLLKKTTNQSTTSGSNVSVNELTFSATIGKTYHIRGLIITNVNISTASMFFGNSSGSGGVLTTAAGYSSFMVRSTTSTNMVYSQPGNQGWPGIATGYVMVRIEVSFTAAATGTFAFDFSVASSNTATIYAGSYIEYMQAN